MKSGKINDELIYVDLLLLYPRLTIASKPSDSFELKLHVYAIRKQSS